MPDESPGVLVRYKYDPTGQLVEVWDRTDQLVRRFDYNADHLMTLHADAAGLECRYEWQGQGRWARVVRHWTKDGESYDISYRMLAQSPAEGASEPNAVAGYTTAVDQLGRVQTWAWNDEFCVLSYTNPLGATWRATYDELKQRLSLVAPNGGTTTYRYDELGLPTAETDVLGRTWSTSWTPLGLPWMETAPDGSVDRFAYDDHGNLTRHTAPDSSETHFVYDNRGLPLRVTDAKGGVKRLRWSVRAQMLEYTDCSAQSTQYAYDGSGHLSRVTDALGHITEFTHDPNGKLRAQSLPDGAHLSYGWDAASRLVQSRDALSRSTRFAWNLRGQLTMREDGEGRRVALEYDGARRLARLTNENGESFAFEYNAGDQLIAEHRIGGQRVTVDYDVAGWPVAVTHVPALGDDMLLEGGARTEGHTPEISGWGDKLAAPTAASGPQPCRTDLIRDAAGRLLEKRTASHHYHYRYDAVDQLLSATKLQVLGQQVGPTGQPQFNLKPLHTTTFEYDLVGNLVAETATDAQTGQSHTLRHSHDPLGNRTQTQLPTLPGQPYLQRALNYLHYGSGHLHQINYSQRDTRSADALAVHQLISDIERDALHRETARSQGRLGTRYALDPLGRRLGAWSRSASLVSAPYSAQDKGWQQAILSAGTSSQSPLDGLMKAYAYDKVGELRQTRHSLHGDTAHGYDATGRIERSTRQPFAGHSTAPSEAFQYDPAGNILDGATQQALSARTQHPQLGYVKDNLVRVFEDKRFFYDGHGRLIRKLSGKHTAQTFSWDDESRLVEVSTTRRPGTEHQTTQVTRFDYDALGRRVAKHDSFGSTVFIWEGMRLIEERRGSSVISYVYEPDSYVPLARLDASGDKTDQGGLGTQDDAALPPLPLGEGGGEGHAVSKTIAARAGQTGAEGLNHSKPAANDAEALYWASLNQQAEQKAQALAIEGWGTGTDGPAKVSANAKIAEVYYFHTDQVGLPEELSNAQGQLVWQATYKTWGNTQAEEWKLVEADGSKTHPLDAGDQPENEARQQNLRFQGQYLDRDTGLHYNTFRYYDPDIGRFISPDPIGLEGGINLGSYSPNPVSWIDPWGLSCGNSAPKPGRRGAFRQAKRDAGISSGQQPDAITRVPMTDRSGRQVLGSDGKPIMTREYTYTRADGSKVVIQEHSAGHKFGQGGIGDQGPHFNVRPSEQTRTGSVPGTKDHYPW